MKVPILVNGEQYEGVEDNYCLRCDQPFTRTDSLQMDDFCSFVCEHLWAEEHGEVAIRRAGRFPRIGYIDGEFFTFPSNPTALLDKIKGYPIDLFTFLQHPARTAVAYPYRMELDNMAVLPISTFDNWWKNQTRYSARKQVKKAERAGIEVGEGPLTEELLQAICAIYNERPFRQGRKFAYYGITLEQVRRMTCTFPQRSIYLSARLDGRIIGFVKLVTEGTRFATVLHILSLSVEHDKSPTNALIAHAVKLCSSRGISQLTYGRYNYGNKETDGLLQFKLTNGFERLDVPRYYVPQTLRGEIAYRVGLHHRLRERVPESAAKVLRSLRAWYVNYGKDTNVVPGHIL